VCVCVSVQEIGKERE